MKQQVRFWLKHGGVRDVVTACAEGFSTYTLMAHVKAAGHFQNDTMFVPYDNIALAVVEPLNTDVPLPHTTPAKSEMQ